MAILRLLCVGLVCGVLCGCSVGSMGGGGTSTLATYSINAPDTRAANVQRWPVQVAIQLPTAARALDTDRILVSAGSGRVSYFSDAAWSDRLPRLLHSRIAAAMQDSGAFNAVLSPLDRIDGDYTLTTEIRDFQIQVNGSSVAAVTLVAKMVNEKRGNVLGTKEFSVKLPASKDDPDSGVAALQNGFNQVTVEMVRWAASFRGRQPMADASSDTLRKR